jgi:protein-disulfide isomerase
MESTEKTSKGIHLDLPVVCISAIFLVASVTKVFHLSEFWSVLDQVGVLPSNLVVPLSGVLIALEIVIAFGLWFKISKKISALGSSFLFLVFGAFHFSRIMNGQSASCGCFTGILNLNGFEGLGLSIVMLIASLIVLRGIRRPFRIPTLIKRADLALLALSLCVAATFLILGVRARNSQLSVLSQTSEKELTEGAPTEGDPKSNATLVIFLDYQCEPCRNTHRRIEQLLANNPEAFKVVYRNLPLVTIHPYSIDAALAAIAAREQGRFWPVQKELLAVSFDRTAIQKLLDNEGIDWGAYKKAVKSTALSSLQKDRTLAKKLGFESTPTLVLCQKGNGIIRLNSTDDLITKLSLKT